MAGGLFEGAVVVTGARVGFGDEAGTASDEGSGIPPGTVGFAIESAGVSAIGGS